MKNSNDTIWNRTSDLPICITAPYHGVTAVSNRKEYQEYFLGGEGGRCLGLTTLPPSCTDFMQSGSLKLLEPSWPVQGLLYLQASMWIRI